MGPPKLRTSALPKKEIKGGCRGGGLGRVFAYCMQRHV